MLWYPSSQRYRVFHPMLTPTRLEQSVRDDVAWLKAQDLIAPGAKDNIRGYIFHVHKDPKQRRLQRIDPPEEEEEEEK
jgi:hypothetical protein